MADHKVLKVRVRDSQHVLFEGEVDRISSYNEDGVFDVYPMHINFISIVQKQISFFKGNQKIKEVKVEKAIMKVKKDDVHIFLGIEAFVLDPEDAMLKKS